MRLVYNQRFSRLGRGQRHSYSVPLIPDIALRVPDGPNAGLHLFDAKFRVQALTDVGLAADDKDADDEKAARAGGFVQACRHLQDARLPRRDSETRGRCGSFIRVGSFGSLGCRGVAGRLATGRVLRLRGCRKSLRGWARFRWLRSSEGRGAMAWEWRLRVTARCG